MQDEPLTWDNVPGLSDDERRIGRSLIEVPDLRMITIEGVSADGVFLPPIVNGVVIR
ncbi:hypothetical protein J7E45_16055 [Microbacterium sp. ISL-59]|uniref:hypothetical protein n=1 Tax=Microbacterium sp. ISL-59 TaxID=2819159 RepID=UPI001BE7265D|nr:hypothetical protein [Microbacterium sp. ISL-59]MBT2497126.1 hypothetical protein [Microbacterium sp. ISL-59]